MRNVVPFLLALACLVTSPAAAELGMGIFVGGYTGDRLYSASSEAPRSWHNPTGDVTGTGDALLVDQESWLQLGLNGWTSLNDRWGLRFDIAYTDVDLDGKVHASSGATETVQWDQWFILDVLAQATWRIGRSRDTYPYLAAGPGLSVVSSEGDTLGQVMPNFNYGAGWRISALTGAYLDLSVRGQLQWPDLDDEEARLAADEFEGESITNALSVALTVGRVF